MTCPCHKHPFGCYGHPLACGCRQQEVSEIDRLRAALEQIDATAVSKKAGALVRMQRIARQALAKYPEGPNVDRTAKGGEPHE